MPKRKSKEDFEYLSKKLRKLERKIRRRTQHDTPSSPESVPHPADNEDDVTPIDLEPPIEISDVNVNKDNLQSEIINPQYQAEPSVDMNQADTSLFLEPVPGTSGVTNMVVEPPELILDNDIFEILGIDPTTTTKYGKDVNNDLAVRLQHYSTTGLSKDMRKELTDKYPTPSNCKFIDAPQLNPEIKAALTDQITKRDKNIELKQKQVATAISCLSNALTSIFASKNKDTSLIRSLMDTSRILCDCQYNDSITRRNFILSSLKKEMKEQLQNSKVDNFLFGENLNETLKAARAINKSGAELKANPPSKTFVPKKTAPGQSKNWKAPVNKKPPPLATQKTKETATLRNRPSTSYKQSQPRYNNNNRR